jgi:hypothetical protein
MVLVLKTGVGDTTEGSNPSASARVRSCNVRHEDLFQVRDLQA